jgi:hypothetical protein
MGNKQKLVIMRDSKFQLLFTEVFNFFNHFPT